ncbi:MAG: MFS transporter [Chitinophagales bacterium]|nr:MFS transporter [Chitinophagales bacterium]
MRIITRTIWMLSLVSMFTDMASEMLYPVMPVFLQSIGFSVALIGVLEGVAEATAGLSKGYFGKLSDNMGKRLPFVRLGYLLSALSKPMMAFFQMPWWIFAARTTDRLGKGIRTGARDAMLSDETTKENKARVFGFHRSWDTIGAVIGPSLALLFLYYYPGNYIMLFYIAFIPGLAAIIFTFIIRKDTVTTPVEKKRTSFFDFVRYWKQSPASYRKLLTGLLLFALVNSSDVFLLLRAKDAGLNDTTVISVYVFYNLIYALFSYPVGVLADKLGLKNIFIFGLVLFVIVYFIMSGSLSFYFYMLAFLLYGIYAAATEGVAKAWITNIADKQDTATAIGTYTAFQSIAALLASSITGMLWYSYGAELAFIVTALATTGVIVYLMTVRRVV